MYRQGDVLIERIEKVNGKKQKINGNIILAYGEATGHHHAIKDDTTMLFHGPNGEVYIDVTEHTELTHQEHSSIAIPPGKYRVVRQREYTPEAIRNVID